MITISGSRTRRSAEFRKVTAGFLGQPGLPFADVLPVERIARVFAKYGSLFGREGAVYTAAMTLWAFLCQVLSDRKESSCRAAVARIVVHQQVAALHVPTADTGDYCRARAKLEENCIRANGSFHSASIASYVQSRGAAHARSASKQHRSMCASSHADLPTTAQGRAGPGSRAGAGDGCRDRRGPCDTGTGRGRQYSI